MGWSDKAKAATGTTEGVITDYVFMDTFPFGGDDDDKASDNDNLYMLLDITPDGADEATQKSLYLGSGQFLRIEEKGKVLVSSDDDGVPRLYDQGEVFKFIESLEAAGFPAEARFPDPTEEKVIDLRGMLGTRIRVTNEVDSEATKRYGKRKVTKGKHKGKEFNRTYLKVTKVLDLPDEDKPVQTKKATNGSGKVMGKTKTTEAEESGCFSNKVADGFLTALLGDQKNQSIEKAGLPLAITRRAAKDKDMDSEDRDAIRRLLTSTEYLEGAAERGLIAFDASSRKQVVALA